MIENHKCKLLFYWHENSTLSMNFHSAHEQPLSYAEIVSAYIRYYKIIKKHIFVICLKQNIISIKVFGGVLAAWYCLLVHRSRVLLQENATSIKLLAVA